jgi:hypothetical protein
MKVARSAASQRFDLGTAPAYAALSYAWGETELVCLVLVNQEDGRLNIRPNLHRLPVNARREKSYYLWIDQICIDQASTLVRNHHIRLMSKIYSHCYMTIVWLNDASGSCAEAGHNFADHLRTDWL